MNLTVEPKYLDKPWKVMLWVYGFDGVVRLPLRLFNFSLETFDFYSSIRFVLFFVAVFLTGVLYVKSTKKLVDKNLRLKVSLYIAAITLFFWIVFSLLPVFDKIMAEMFGGIIVGILTTVINFLGVYFILPLGNRFVEKK